MRGAGKRQVTSGFGSFRIGHLANHSARSLFCEPIRIKGKYIHVAGSRRGKWVRKGRHWFALTNQKTGSQFREPIRTRCKDILLVPSAGKCRRVVIGWKSLSGANFFKADHNANQCIKTNVWRIERLKKNEAEPEEPYSKSCSCLLFLTFFVCFPFRDMFLAAGENLKAIDIIGQNGWVEK